MDKDLTKDEWLASFALTNGRDPSAEEISQALEAGDFKLDQESTTSNMNSWESQGWSEVSETSAISNEKLAPEPVASTSQSVDKEPVSSSKKICVNCQSELSPKAKFCPNCGVSQETGQKEETHQSHLTKQELQDQAKNYWSWLKQVLLHPVTSKTRDMSTSNMWLSFGIILTLLSLSFGIMFGSFLAFVIVAVFGTGLVFLFAWLFGVLSNAIMKSHFKFFDIFKMGLQAEIFFVPISGLIFIFSLLARLTTRSAFPSMMSNYSNYSSYSNDAGNYLSAYPGQMASMVGLGFFGFLIYLLVVFAAAVGSGMFLMGLYREIVALPDHKIDRYPWFVLAILAIALVLAFILMIILAGILFSAIHMINGPGGLGY